jgi:hypothetical protein
LHYTVQQVSPGCKYRRLTPTRGQLPRRKAERVPCQLPGRCRCRGAAADKDHTQTRQADPVGGDTQVRANLMGAALQLPLEPVCMVRDWVVANLYDSTPFLDHASYDCGRLPQP